MDEQTSSRRAVESLRRSAGTYHVTAWFLVMVVLVMVVLMVVVWGEGRAPAVYGALAGLLGLAGLGARILAGVTRSLADLREAELDDGARDR